MKLSFKAHPLNIALMVAVFLWLPGDLALGALVALALHEGAHLLSMWLCHVKACTVELTPFGGVADVYGFDALSGWKQAAIALSGVMGSAAAACLCYCLSPMDGFWRCLFNVSLAMALLNCLPLWPLDGARVALALGRHWGIEKPVCQAMLLLSYALGVGMVALGLYGAWHGYVNLSLFLLGPYLAYAAHESARCCRIRGMERLCRGELNPGELRLAQTFVCQGKPSPLQMTRLLNATPERRTGLLTVLNADSGKVERLMSQPEIAEELFDTSCHNSKG